MRVTPHRHTTTRRTLIALASVTALSAGLIVGAQAEPDKKVTVHDVKQAFHRVEAVSEQVNGLKEQIKQTKQEIDDLSEDIDRQMVGYRAQRDALSSAIVQQHMDAPLGPTVNLLGSRDPEEFLDGLGAVQALNSTRADALESFGRTAKQLKNRKAQLEDRRKALERDQKDVAKKKREIRKKYDAARAALGMLSAADQSAFTTSDLNLGFEVDASGRGARAIQFAQAQLGDPYVYGGTGPNSWDCSGLVMKSFAAAGVSLPRVVGPQYAAVRHIPMSALQPGDIVFYGDMSHDGIYVGHGKVIHAPHPGRSVEYTGLGGFSKAGRVG